jgi:hypothetical protein
MRAAVGFLGAFLLASSTFAAEVDVCPDVPVDEDDRKALAGVWFAKGERLVEIEEYAMAIVAFKCSLEMVEHSATLYNAAQAARLGQQHAVALELLKRWLKLSPYDEMTDEVTKQIGELEKLVADEQEPEQPEPDVVPESGAGQVQQVDEPEEVDDGSSLRTAGWAMFGIGAAGAVAGAVFQGLAAKYKSDAEATSKPGQWDDLSGKTDTFQKTAIVAFVVGGVALGAGVTMIVLGSGDDDGGGSSAEIAIVPAPGGLLVQGSF